VSVYVVFKLVGAAILAGVPSIVIQMTPPANATDPFN